MDSSQGDNLEELKKLAAVPINQQSSGISGVTTVNTWPTANVPCPSCGHCPTCGRQENYYPYNYYPYYWQRPFVLY